MNRPAAAASIGFGSLVAGLLVLAVGAPANAASAASPTPGELASCTAGAPADGGGWDHRQYVGSGTDDASWAFQIRPRTITLGEVCVSSGNLAIPYQVNDLPTEGSYFAGGTQFRICGDGGNTSTCIEYLDTVKLTNGDNDNVWTMCFLMEPSYSAVVALGHRVNRSASTTRRRGTAARPPEASADTSAS